MPADEVHLHVRMRRAVREKIDELAASMGENRSEWVNRVVETEIRRYLGMSEGRSVRVQEGRLPRMRVARPRALCNHPAQLRSEPHPTSGETRCMACDAIVRPYR